jgi:hypothetical protein
MPKHDITVIQPARTTLHSDYTVEIKSDNAILGKLSISKGAASTGSRRTPRSRGATAGSSSPHS